VQATTSPQSRTDPTAIDATTNRSHLPLTDPHMFREMLLELGTDLALAQFSSLAMARSSMMLHTASRRRISSLRSALKGPARCTSTLGRWDSCLSKPT